MIALVRILGQTPGEWWLLVGPLSNWAVAAAVLYGARLVTRALRERS